MSHLFVRRGDDEAIHIVQERQESFLRGLVEAEWDNLETMRAVFGVVSGFLPATRLEFFDLFLSRNKRFEDFERLALEPGWWSISGSAVPVLQSRLDFLEVLQSRLNTVELLRHKQHVGQYVQSVRDQIEREKRRDFIEG
jgi:hypothetical protein